MNGYLISYHISSRGCFLPWQIIMHTIFFFSRIFFYYYSSAHFRYFPAAPTYMGPFMRDYPLSSCLASLKKQQPIVPGLSSCQCKTLCRPHWGRCWRPPRSHTANAVTSNTDTGRIYISKDIYILSYIQKCPKRIFPILFWSRIF
jgi:hypothetical protein